MAGIMRYFRRHEAFFRRAGIAVLFLISFIPLVPRILLVNVESITPGDNALTSILYLAKSKDADLVRPINPHLDDE